jgi:hypothetical protein
MADSAKISTHRDQSSLGTSLTSWVYRSKRSSSFMVYVIGLMGAAVVFVLLYARHFVPLLKEIPDGALYFVVFLIGPLLNLVKSLGRDRQYALYENGFTITVLNKGAAAGENKVGYWADYTQCTYNSNSVTLSSGTPIRGKIRLMISENVSAIYSICRERINIAQAQKLHFSNRAPSTPNTAEQRKLKSFEQQSQWKRTFPGDRKRTWPV